MSCKGAGICNGRDISTGEKLMPDVCVIGAGPAGIAAAAKLGEAGFKVVLLDGSRQLNYPPPLGSGDECYFRKSWPDKAELYKGVATGLFHSNEPEFLTLPSSASDYIPPCGQPWSPFQPWERERVFGGTPVHGGGQCRPQDLIDIEGRSPDFPKWPVTYDELNEFYKEASIANYLTGDYPGNFTTEFWAKKLGLKGPVPAVPGFDTEMYQFMGKWKNFATRPWGGGKTIDHLVQVIVNATVTKIVVASGAMNYLEVKSMQDNYPKENPVGVPKVDTTFRIFPRICILACGTVENARQLLLSTIPDKDKKLVGHYFMCHPLSKDEIIRTTGDYLLPDQFNFMQGNFCVRKQGDKCVQWAKWSDTSPESPGNTIEGRFIANPKTTRDNGIGRCWFWASQGGGGARMYFEMAPNYESCVALDPKNVDQVFKQPLTKINWVLKAADEKTYTRNCELFKAAVGGKIWYLPWKDTLDQNQWVVNGHHMGTTRMSVKPEEGVVDPNLQMYGAANLFVAGASVFPTGGISNPTFTIVALSLRLAAHVQKLLGKPKAATAKTRSKAGLKRRVKKAER